MLLSALPSPTDRPLRVAIYARVSLGDKQHVENQVPLLEDFARRHGTLDPAHVYVDQVSGGTPERAAFKAMMKAGHQRQFDLLVFWALDRFSREGVKPTLDYLAQLDAHQVAVKSYTEQYLDSLGPFRDMFLSMLATFAKLERAKISDRTKAGLQRLRNKGVKLGRQAVPDAVVQQIYELHRAGLSVRQIATAVELSKSVVGKYAQGYTAQLATVVKNPM